MIIELVRESIASEPLFSQVTRPDCGALVCFQGTVRNHHQGREVLRLEYTAYESMALSKMRELATDLEKRWPVHDLAIVHRLGVLEIGETSILIALCLPHRSAGFEALRYAIDTFKREVPIWKKEHFADGDARWVEGS